MATQTISALFDHYEDAERAVRELKQEGVPDADISIVANESARTIAEDGTTRTGEPANDATGTGTGATIGTLLGGGAGLLAGIGALAIPGVGPVIAAGWLVATLTGAGVGAATGGLLGSLADVGHSKEHAEIYSEGVRRGGTLVSVRYDDAVTGNVRAILDRHHPVDVNARAATYRETGWTGYDPAAQPYTTEEIQRERERVRINPNEPTTIRRAAE